jgi:hypothetical protein
MTSGQDAQTLCSKEKEMATYLVCLNAKNFLVDDDEFPKKKGFRTTRLVEAENPKRAEAIARELLGNDPRLADILNEASDPPVIHLESVIEVPAMAYDAQKRANAFYWENEDNY